MNDRVPCRVSADLRALGRKERDAQLDRPDPIPFDETDDGIMHDIFGGERMANVVQPLLLTLRDIKAIEASFGAACVDKGRFFDLMVERLQALREACNAEWNDL